MGISTKCVIKEVKLFEIESVLDKYFEKGYVWSSETDNTFHVIDFTHKGISRSLSISRQSDDYKELGFQKATVLSLGFNAGINIDIMKIFLKEFGGGFLDENDCDGINYEEYIIRRGELVKF